MTGVGWGYHVQSTEYVQKVFHTRAWDSIASPDAAAALFLNCLFLFRVMSMFIFMFMIPHAS